MGSEVWLPTNAHPTRRLRRRIGQSSAAAFLAATQTGNDTSMPDHRPTGEAISCRAPSWREGSVRVLALPIINPYILHGSGGFRRPSAGVAQGTHDKNSCGPYLRIRSRIDRTLGDSVVSAFRTASDGRIVSSRSAKFSDFSGRVNMENPNGPVTGLCHCQIDLT